jgi:hypothetical protein
MATTLMMQVPGAVGGSLTRGYEGWFVVSRQRMVTRTPAVTNTGRPTFEGLNVEIPIQRGIADLMLLAMKQTSLARLTVDALNTNAGSSVRTLRIELNTALLTSFEIVDDVSSAPDLCSIVITAAKMSVSNSYLSPAGAVVNETVRVFNFATGTFT